MLTVDFGRAPAGVTLWKVTITGVAGVCTGCTSDTAVYRQWECQEQGNKAKRTLDKVLQTSNGTSSVMHVWAQRELMSVLSERSDTNTAKVTLHAFICCYLQNSSPTWFALNSRIICCGGWIDDANKGTKKKQDKYSETADSEGLADTSVQN